MSEEGVSPIDVVKFEENLKHLPVAVLKDILSEVIQELDRRGVEFI